MSDFPESIQFMAGKPAVSPYSILSMGAGGSLGGAAATAWPVANTALLIPFRLPQPRLVYGFGVFNGTVSGNLDVGIYTLDGVRICSKGSTVQAGASGQQQVNLSSAVGLGPGAFYLVLVLDNTTGQVFRHAPPLAFVQGMGMAQVASAFPLPATLTPASLASAYVPAVAAYLRSSP